jgi:hypothetical protein
MFLNKQRKQESKTRKLEKRTHDKNGKKNQECS